MNDQLPIEPTLDEAVLRRWIGTRQSHEDRIDCRQANLLRVTLDPERPPLQAGDRLPAGWHWIGFPEAPPLAELGRDGHASLGEFLPPVALPRRMWAGTRLRFYTPILTDEPLRKVSQVTDVQRKTGRSGELCFVTVRHRYFSGEDSRLEEEHDIVYRGTEPPATQRAAPRPVTRFERSIQIVPTTTLLFRYSALTFNGHRIHYDLDFCRNVERYPGLLVHAPLIATLMLGLAEASFAERNLTLCEFRQRSVAPLFHDQPFTIGLNASDRGYELLAVNRDGLLASTAEAIAEPEQAPARNRHKR